MIRNDAEYKEAVQRLQAERQRLAEHEQRLKEQGLDDAERKRALDPLRSFHLQLEEEVGSYDRLKRGDFDEIVNFRGLGRFLIGLRIARGFTQKQIAELLQVHETQVSRDERNEYHGITVERASKILEALNFVTRTVCEWPDRPTLRQHERLGHGGRPRSDLVDEEAVIYYEDAAGGIRQGTVRTGPAAKRSPHVSASKRGGKGREGTVRKRDHFPPRPKGTTYKLSDSTKNKSRRG